MTVLLTGAAGFIGFHVAKQLLARGERVIGVDDLNDYYDVRLKEARLAQIEGDRAFRFLRLDLGRENALAGLLADEAVDRVVHLAAQAGVRHSLTAPFDYVRSNLTGHMVVLEYCRHRQPFRHLVYASSSSVYGGNQKQPFAETDPVDRPVSLYAATKRADELMSHTYAHLYGLPQTGLRFFTVYGPWGRPDMAMWLFTEAILAGRPITLFNHGRMRRDFTYIDDIVSGVVAALDRPPEPNGQAPHRLYNIGNSDPHDLWELIGHLERATGRKAETRLAPMQPGDVAETFADTTLIARDLGFRPMTPLAEGVERFVAWYRSYNAR
ncbi:MAG: NAD-dependent epimerase/dehydratase family protein [Alphaproteobacteria bacterium]|nr:NAD-dependent epimerase/dehydratase family protein [Alphaproteobacteria bacterium]